MGRAEGSVPSPLTPPARERAFKEAQDRYEQRTGRGSGWVGDVVDPPSPRQEPRPTSGHPGRTGLIDWARQDRLARTIGRRGEEAVVAAERRRLERLGFDPRAVVGDPARSSCHHTTGRASTTTARSSTSRSRPQPARRDRPLHRQRSGVAARCRAAVALLHLPVVDAGSAVPRIVRYRDPIGRVTRGQAVLSVQGARMAFGDRGESLTAAEPDGRA